MGHWLCLLLISGLYAQAPPADDHDPLEFMKKALAIYEVHAHDERGPRFQLQAEPVIRFIKLGWRDVWTAQSKDTGQRSRPDDPYYDLLVPRRHTARDTSPSKKAEP